MLVFCLYFYLVHGTNNSAKNAHVLKPHLYDTLYPVIYNALPTSNGEYAFRTIPAKTLKVKLIPNLETRAKMKLHKIDHIIGVHQFFLDHDLVSGFVHPFTKNMFDKLQSTQFVLKFTSTDKNKMIGNIGYIRKSQLTKGDTLGKNIAYFRQWRLSEIDYKVEKGIVYIHANPCNFNKRCACPESKLTGNMRQIPLWQKAEIGIQPLNKFNAFGRENGGTVALIWEYNHEIFFQDIHSSWSEILERAIEVSKQYRTDPSIAISDAGPLAYKLKANRNYELNVSAIDALAPSGKRFGAGYGYIQGNNK